MIVIAAAPGDRAAASPVAVHDARSPVRVAPPQTSCYAPTVRIAALDVGDARIGVAVTDARGSGAHAAGVVERVGGRRDFEAIARLVGEPPAGRFVVGLPLNLDDSEGPRARKTRAFGERLAAHFGVPVDFWDERLTTFEATERLRAAGVRARRQRGLRDQIAATIILEEYLAHRPGAA